MNKKRMSGGKKAIIVICCIVVVLVGVSIPLKMPGASATDQLKPFMKQPIAHRGYFDNDSAAPENSLAAFQRAIDHGYAIELDTQLTADGTVIVLHDKSLLRSSGVDRNVDDMTDAELAECRLFGSSEKVPISEATAKLLDEYDGVYVVQSFNPFALQWFMNNRPDIPRGLLAKDFIADGEGQSFVNRIALTGMFTNVVARPNFISYELKSDGQPTFEAMQAFTDLPCFAWTLKSQEELDQAKAAGFEDFIFDSFEAKL